MKVRRTRLIHWPGGRGALRMPGVRPLRRPGQEPLPAPDRADPDLLVVPARARDQIRASPTPIHRSIRKW